MNVCIQPIHTPKKMNIYCMRGWIYTSSAHEYILHRPSKYYCVFHADRLADRRIQKYINL